MARLRSHAPEARPLNGFTLIERMAFVSGWLPAGQHEPRPRPWAACRWTCWREYLADFASVEAELRGRFPRRELFGARVRAYAARHGVEALNTISYVDLRGED